MRNHPILRRTLSLLALAGALALPSLSEARPPFHPHRQAGWGDRPYVQQHGHRPFARPWAQVAPPAPRYEVRPRVARAGWSWTPGYWGWSRAGYAWTPGAWALAPGPRYTWVQPQWVADGAGWRFQPGYWAQY